MPYDFSKYGLNIPEILLPGEEYDLAKWAVVACDQYTSQPEYWQEVDHFVGDAPSALRIVYPEAWLGQGDARIEKINRAMEDYEKNVLSRRVESFVLVERAVTHGNRLGLMACIDLEKYNFSPDSRSLIRATEGTILSRIPPRVRIRKDAPLELPHVLVLVDDPAFTLIEPIYAQRDRLHRLYEFDLMQGGGHIRGWRVSGDLLAGIQEALDALYQKADGLLFAVGDGNHSLATARECWLAIREGLSEEARETHPARFALVEMNNLHDPSLVFEPIHRVLFGGNMEIVQPFAEWLKEKDMRLLTSDERDAMFVYAGKQNRRPLSIEGLGRRLPLSVLQEFLDEYLCRHTEMEIDYVHGEDALLALVNKGAQGFVMRSMDKFALFDGVRASGVLPRKTFSMGEANEKRFYLECRRIK